MTHGRDATVEATPGLLTIKVDKATKAVSRQEIGGSRPKVDQLVNLETDRMWNGLSTISNGLEAMRSPSTVRSTR